MIYQADTAPFWERDTTGFSERQRKREAAIRKADRDLRTERDMYKRPIPLLKLEGGDKGKGGRFIVIRGGAFSDKARRGK